MSQENVEIVRARYEQFARGDFSQMADVADDFELVTTRLAKIPTRVPIVERREFGG